MFAKVGEMVACCMQAQAMFAAAETSSITRGCSSSTSSSISTRWSARRAGGVQVERKGHLGTRLMVVETGVVASKQRASGLVVKAAKRVSMGHFELHLED